jgi:hypothetical protein
MARRENVDGGLSDSPARLKQGRNSFVRFDGVGAG